MLKRSLEVVLSSMILVLVFSTDAFAQTYPAKSVRMIVSSGPGSGSDVIARYLAELVSNTLRQPFLVENRAGAAGNIAFTAGARSPADGYTLVLGGLGVNVMNQFLYPPGSLGFDPEKDLDPVLLVARLPFLIAVSPSFQGNSLQGLVAAAKAKPGNINVAITNNSQRVVFELFNQTSGAQLFAVAYKGPAAALSDVMSGRVTVAIETVAALRPHVASGKLKALAITTRSTSDLMPGLESVVDQGLPAFGEFVGWMSMYMPKASPQDAINIVNAAFNKVLAMPETRRRFADLGAEPGSGTPQDMARFEDSERKRWGPIIKAAGIRAE